MGYPVRDSVDVSAAQGLGHIGHAVGLARMPSIALPSTQLSADIGGAQLPQPGDREGVAAQIRAVACHTGRALGRALLHQLLARGVSCWSWAQLDAGPVIDSGRCPISCCE